MILIIATRLSPHIWIRVLGGTAETKRRIRNGCLLRRRVTEEEIYLSQGKAEEFGVFKIYSIVKAARSQLNDIEVNKRALDLTSSPLRGQTPR